MRQNRRLHPRATIAIAAAWLVYAGPVAANDEQAIGEPNPKLAAEVLIRVEAGMERRRSSIRRGCATSSRSRCHPTRPGWP